MAVDSTPPRFYYGNVILGACFLNTALMRGCSGSFGVFYVALLDQFAWSHGVAASIVSINSIVYAIISPAVGYALDRLGPRRLLPSAGLFLGLGLGLSGFSSSLWQFYVFYGVLAAIGQSGLGFVTQNALISHWFIRRRATAIGVAAAGQGLGVIIIVPLSQLLISRFGWRVAFLVLGALVLLLIVPANALVQRRHPGEVGQLPDGDMPDPVGARAPALHKGSRSAWTLVTALRAFPFWTLAAGHLVLGMGLALVYTHIVAHLIHHGFDRLEAASALALIGFMRVVGPFTWGYASDRLGREKSYGLSVLITLAGLVALLVIDEQWPLWWVYGAGTLFGIGHSAANPTYGAIIGDIFGGRNVGTIFGCLEVTFGLGMAFGSWSGGVIYDSTGSYPVAFAAALTCFVAAFFAIRFCTAWRERHP